MDEQAQLQFKSRWVERETMAICRVHRIDFEQVAGRICRRNILVAPGTVDLAAIEVGRDRVLESPSRMLDFCIQGAVAGTALAMGCPILVDESEILEGVDLI